VFDSDQGDCGVRNGIGVPAAGSLLFIFVDEYRAPSCWYLCWYRQQSTIKVTSNSNGYGTKRLPARKDHGARSTRQFQQLVGVKCDRNRGRRRNRVGTQEADASRLARSSLPQWVNFVSDFAGDQLGGPDAMVHLPNCDLGNRTGFAPETA
jgi:hypothetical protein